jgi:hypothetical protein
MLPRGQRALVDTNVIIESHRTKIWNALAGYFALETVEMCCTESATGDKSDPDYVPVDTEHLRQNAAVHPVSERMIVSAALRASGLTRLDDGEKELLAFAATEEPAKIVISSPDFRAMEVAEKLGLLDCFVSLEELAEIVGTHPMLKSWYSKGWLTSTRTAIKLECL